MLWQRDDSFDARGSPVSSSPTEVFATYTISAECVLAIDELERQWQRPLVVVTRDARTMLAVIFREKHQKITQSMFFLGTPDTVAASAEREIDE